MLSRYWIIFFALLFWQNVALAELPEPLHSEEAHERGRKIYNFRCYYCHGYSGDAKTLASSFVTPPPRDFTKTDPTQLTRDAMIHVVTHGKPGTAMRSFSALLSPEEMLLVIDFVRSEFMTNRLPNTHYHTAANGWPNHERLRSAFPFATGEIALDTPHDELTPLERKGRRLFMTTCITCHDRARVLNEGNVWEIQAVSYPRPSFLPGDSLLPPDTITGATPFAKHEIPPEIPDLNETEQAGEKLFQANCAFCHAFDGTGKNWIGTFLKPPARDLTQLVNVPQEHLIQVISNGLPLTSMPAWKHVLTNTEIDSIANYVSKAFQRPDIENSASSSDR